MWTAPSGGKTPIPVNDSEHSSGSAVRASPAKEPRTRTAPAIASRWARSDQRRPVFSTAGNVPPRNSPNRGNENRRTGRSFPHRLLPTSPEEQGGGRGKRSEHRGSAAH